MKLPGEGKPFSVPGVTGGDDIAPDNKETEMVNILQLMPTLEGDEMVFLQGLLKDMPDNQVQQFANVYGSRRKDPQTVLLMTLLGFVGFAGVQRFYLDQIGMGLVYLFTIGFCFIGTLIDLVNHKKLAYDYNTRVAQQVVVMVKAAN